VCLERVVGIWRRVFQFIFNITGKKVMSKEEIMQLTKEFPMPRDRRAADYKDNKKKDKIWDGADLIHPFPSPFHPEQRSFCIRKLLHNCNYV